MDYIIDFWKFKTLAFWKETWLVSGMLFFQFSASVVSNSLWPHGLHARFPCPSPAPELAQTHGHPTISSSVIPFSSCLQSYPASGSFPMSQFLASCGHSTGDSVSASVLPVNIRGWFALGLTGLISLQSKGFSRVFSNARTPTMC